MRQLIRNFRRDNKLQYYAFFFLTFFYRNRKKYWFGLLMDLPVLRCPDHDLIIPGKCLSVSQSVCDKNFVTSTSRELIHRIHEILYLELSRVVSFQTSLTGIFYKTLSKCSTDQHYYKVFPNKNSDFKNREKSNWWQLTFGENCTRSGAVAKPSPEILG